MSRLFFRGVGRAGRRHEDDGQSEEDRQRKHCSDEPTGVTEDEVAGPTCKDTLG